MEPNDSYCVHEIPPLFPILIHLKPFYALTPIFFNIWMWYICAYISNEMSSPLVWRLKLCTVSIPPLPYACCYYKMNWFCLRYLRIWCWMVARNYELKYLLWAVTRLSFLLQLIMPATERNWRSKNIAWIDGPINSHKNSIMSQTSQRNML
jgi:hypothetical protein